MELNSGIQISSRSGFGGAQQSSMIMAEGSQSQQFARPSRAAADIEEDTMWQMNFRLNEEPMESSASYPERPGEHDCAYYIRTGLCRFGATCRFNHPPNRRLAVAAARIKGGYPERIGQPECQYYLKTGTCKFGATCKFHHPRDKAGIAGRVMLNVLGYPLRPNEKECTYYLRTGQCKYGNTCKFHHPQPTSAMVSLRDSTVYPPVHSPSTPSQQSYPGGLPNWSLSRASFVQSPRWQGPSSYAQVILPPGVVSVPGWSTYPGQLGSVSSSEGQQQGLGSGQFYGTTRQNETASAGTQGTFPSYQSGSIPIGLFPLQRENAFPERPDQPECQFYMKTGDCKFGAGCRFHHPRERLIPVPNCVLSPLGLPLRPGEPLCVFYSRYGICKFGPTCKFDHPMGTFAYGLTASSADVPIVRRLLGSSTSGNPALPALASEASVEGKSRRLLLSETRQISPGEESIETEGGSHPTSSIGPASSFP